MSLRLAALVRGAVHLTVVVVYFLEFGISKRMYVSQILFGETWYMLLLTCALVSQWAAFLVFEGSFCAVGICAVGWIMLCSVYNDADGKTSAVHEAGAVVYMVGDLVCFERMVVSSGSPVALIIISIAAIGCALTYAALFLAKFWFGCLFEHAALIFEVLVFTLFCWQTAPKKAESSLMPKIDSVS